MVECRISSPLHRTESSVAGTSVAPAQLYSPTSPRSEREPDESDASSEEQDPEDLGVYVLTRRHSRRYICLQIYDI